MSVQNIMQTQLSGYPDLRDFSSGSTPKTTSFRCRVFARITGPNWLAVGEAAAMVDPMTSNGVTAALRHAAEASHLIANFRDRKKLPWMPALLYQWRVRSMASFFNSAIEKVLYDAPVRNRIGAFRAGNVYTIPAWSINVIYSRLRPRGLLATAGLGALLASLKMGLHILHSICQRSQSRKTLA